MPVEAIAAPANMAELKAPSISDIYVNGDGEVKMTFSMPMKMPANWVNKYKADQETTDDPIPKEFIEDVT